MLTEVRAVRATAVKTYSPTLTIEALSLHQIKQHGPAIRDHTSLRSVRATSVYEAPATLTIEALSLHSLSIVYNGMVYTGINDKDILVSPIDRNNHNEESLVSSVFDIIEYGPHVGSGDTYVTVDSTPAAPFIGDLTFTYNRVKSIQLNSIKTDNDSVSQLKCSGYIKSCIKEGQVLVNGFNVIRLKENIIFSKDAVINVVVELM